MKKSLIPFSLLLALSFFGCGDPKTETSQPDIPLPTISLQSDAITYKDDTVTCQGMISYNAADSSKRPGVLVVPEWWGVVDFTKSRAQELAKLGYVAMVVDMFGNGKVANNPVEAGNMSMPFYENPAMAKQRLEAALNELKKDPRVDTSRLGAIGYCFGGSVILNASKLGTNLKALVSFHGGLEGVKPENGAVKPKILICQGGNDSFVPQNQLDAFKQQMDAAGANYQVIVYPNATHAFTNPDATANGKKFTLPIKYDAAADQASWKDMNDFFNKNLR